MIKNKSIFRLIILFFLNVLFCHIFRIYLYAEGREILVKNLSELYIQKYQIAQGLPNNLVKTMMLDKRGFVWLGTDEGLVRFDGKRFLHFKNALTSIYTKDILECKDGRILVSHDGGITVVKSSREMTEFTELLKGTSYLSDTTVQYPKTMYEDKNGDIWISESLSIIRLRKGKILKRYFFQERDRSQSFGRSFSFAEDTNEGLIIASQRGYLYKYFPQRDEFKEIPLKTKLEVVSSLHAHTNISGGILIGALRGLFELHLGHSGNDKENIIVQSCTQIADLPDISDICLKDSSTLLIGTWTHGLYSVSGMDKSIKTVMQIKGFHKDVMNAVIYNDVLGILVGTDAGLILAQYRPFALASLPYRRMYLQSVVRGNGDTVFATDGVGIFVISSRTRQVIKTHLSPDESNSILTLSHRGDTIWYGLHDGSLGCLNLRSGKATRISLPTEPEAMFFLICDSRGNVWFSKGGGRKTLFQYSPKTNQMQQYSALQGLQSHPIVFREITNGRLFIGSTGMHSYLYSYNYEKDTIENISIPLVNTLKPTFSINDLCYDYNSNTIWLASSDGLVRMKCDKNARPFSAEIISITDPLTNQEIKFLKSIACDHDRRVWIGTDAGVLLFTEQTSKTQFGSDSHAQHITLFNEQAGLPTSSCALRALIVDDYIGIWVGSPSGLGVGLVRNDERKTLLPAILSIKENGKTIALSTNEFANQAALEFECLSIAFPGDKTVYQYRVKDLSETWSQPTEKNEFTLFQVPSGEHTLEVRALRPGGFIWSDALLFPFRVRLAWYMHPISIIGFILVMGIVTGVSIRINARRLRLKTEELERIVNTRTQDLQVANVEISRQMKLQNEQAIQIQLKNTELHESLETLRRTQSQLVQAEKMASLGTLVAGVAHELNTPIGVAVTAASTLDIRTKEFVKRYSEGGLKKSELEQYVQTAQTGADLTLRNLERAANLIQSFKQVAVDQTRDEARQFKLGAYLQEIVTSLQPMIKTSKHRIEIDCAEEIEMESYPGAISQIITNLVQNSIKHGFEGYREDGVMTVTINRTTNQVTILYSDNGRGIPSEIVPKIFDPFFTTKPGEQGGTGLGLNIVFNLVTQKLGGEVRCEQEQGNGARFLIELPLVVR